MKLNLSNKYLREIIEENLKKLICEESEIVFDIDIRNIPIEDLRKAYKDYRLVGSSMMYGHPLYEPHAIREAVGDICEPDEAIKEIITKYQLPQSLAYKMEHHHNIYVYHIVSLVGINDDLVENDMEKLGYFLSARGNVVVIDGMKFQLMQFEPTSQLQGDITDEVKEKFDTLKHWTPSYNVASIMENGLIPSHKNSMFKYSPRTYLMESGLSDDEMAYIGQQLCFSNKNPNNNGFYSLLNVNIKDLDESVRFFYDPNSNIGIYTEQPLEKDRISVHAVVKFPNRLGRG